MARAAAADEAAWVQERLVIEAARSGSRLPRWRPDSLRETSKREGDVVNRFQGFSDSEGLFVLDTLTG